MVIEFSNFANRAIRKYCKSLELPKYHCTKERIKQKAKEMVDYIIGKVSDTTIKLQECPYVELGKKNGAKGNAFNKRLKWFQYKVSANNAWGVSVLYDENGNALVYRIVHSSYLKEPSPGWKQQSNASQQDKQEVKESAKWIPIQDFNKQIQKENTMKRLNITKKQYSESKYLQKKYGKLEYVSESGKVFKTSKGHLIKLLQESDEDDDRLWILITIEDDDSTNVDVFNRKESVREHLIDSDNFDDEDIDEIMTNGKGDVGWCRVELWHCPIED